MLKVKITVKPSLNKLGQSFTTLNVNKPIKEILEQVVFQTERFAKQITPVDSGRLRASIGGTVTSSLRAEIGTRVKYARFVHWGTRYMRARPFLTDAFEMTIKKMQGRRIEDRIENSIRKHLTRL